MNLTKHIYNIEELEDYISSNELTSKNWHDISYHQKLTESFIEKYEDMIYWGGVSYYQTISEGFIEKYKDKIYWGGISCNQKLSEGFIERFKDKVHWASILVHQKLSYDFLERNLYLYSLYLKEIDVSINKDIILELQNKYKNKYEVDKLSYELRFN